MHSIFYILLFTFTTLLAFSTNLHLLSFLQIDTAKVLDIKEDHKSTTLNSNFVNSSRLYPPLYKLGFLGLTWTLAGWAMMRWCTGGEDSNLVSWRGIPALTGLGVLVGLVVPMNVLFRKERYMFLRFEQYFN